MHECNRKISRMLTIFTKQRCVSDASKQQNFLENLALLRGGVLLKREAQKQTFLGYNRDYRWRQLQATVPRLLQDAASYGVH